MKMIDLHIHTNYSDGNLNPKEVIDEAFKNNVSTISICDHDTIDADKEDVFTYAKSKEIELIVGVEISTKNKEGKFHILGYNFDINNKKLKNKLYILKNARHIYLEKVASKLEELGYKLNIEKLRKIDIVTKAHIANEIINNKENEKKLEKEFGSIPSMGKFIETIMNKNCKAYVKKESITPKEASQLIHEAGGTVFLAHPVSYIYEYNLKEEKIYNLIKEIEADGLESNYIYIDCDNKKHNDINFWNNFASKHNLKTTVGSDFHRNDEIHPGIGLTNENIKLSNKDIEEIKKNIISK